MKWLWRSRMGCVIGLATLMIASAAHAQQPTVVLAVRSVDELLDDAEFIGGEVGQEGLKETAEGFVDQFTGGKGLAGVDRKKALGLYWTATAGGPPEMPVVFIPVSDPAAFKELMTALAPDLKDSKGQWSMTIGGQSVFAKIANGYCFAASSASQLAKPADPAKIVAGKYDISLDVSIASIPQELKAEFLEQAEQQGRANLENSPEPENEAEAKGRELGFEWSLAVIKAMTNDGDRITLGWDVNSKTRMASMDVALSGKSNTALAKAMTAYGKTAPAFAAVAAETAPFRLVISHPTTGLLDQLDGLFDSMREVANTKIDNDEKLADDADKQAAKDVAKRLFDIAQATAKSGSLHSAVVLDSTEDGTVRIVGGTKVANGNDAGKLFDDILKLSKENPDVAKVKADVAKHAGARIHAITPDLDEEHQEMFGDEPGHLAVRTDSLWFSIGGENLAALKKALDLSGKAPTKPVPPISLRIKPAKLVTLFEQDDEGLIERAEKLAGKPGDAFNLDIEPTPSGAKLHIEFGIDLLQLGIDE